MYQPISSDLSKLSAHYDAVVIGSGYGGAIAACRLAQARKADGSRLRVAVLERGRELQPGQYPRTSLEFAAEAQFTAADKVVGRRDGLFDFRANGDLATISACGLGGTSLINAGVAIKPLPWVFADPIWPQGLRDDLDALYQGMDTAHAMLGLTPYPGDRPLPGKLKALQESASAMGAKYFTADVACTFTAGENLAGVAMESCTGCGDCVMGCNENAKNTTLYNYLPLAHRHGAQLFTQVEVRHLEKRGDHWLVHFASLVGDREDFTSDLGCVSTELVVLGAGTQGTNEILMRSRSQGLPLSARLGHRFSGNGDALGFGYNTDVRIDAVGCGYDKPDPTNPPGPCISGIIDLRESEARADLGMVIMEGVVPATFTPFFAGVMATEAALRGRATRDDLGETVEGLVREAEGILPGISPAVRNTQTYLVMCHDDSGGTLELHDGDRVRTVWPNASRDEYLQVVDDRLFQATAALGGIHVPNPTWGGHLIDKLITCHPLGGAVMADDASRGVTNHKGQVFAGETGDTVYGNLLVTDAAVMARSLGVNPLLTISGMAERTMAHLLRDRGWTRDDVRPPAPEPRPQTIGVRFTEKMSGTLGLGDEAAFEPDLMPDSVLAGDASFVVCVQADDLDAVLDRPGHRAALSGTLRCELLHPDPLQIEAGRFVLFAEDPSNPQDRLMQYQFVAVAEDGRCWYVDGVKTLRDGAGLGLLGQST
ncbi:MAG: GMC family oxidoreductase, partial [Deltaproteobacteria bacterium]|nr:GMC family oxidoreductase [Deltaproteobacteria bacterium]